MDDRSVDLDEIRRILDPERRRKGFEAWKRECGARGGVQPTSTEASGTGKPQPGEKSEQARDVQAVAPRGELGEAGRRQPDSQERLAAMTARGLVEAIRKHQNKQVLMRLPRLGADDDIQTEPLGQAPSVAERIASLTPWLERLRDLTTAGGKVVISTTPRPTEWSWASALEEPQRLLGHIDEDSPCVVHMQGRSWGKMEMRFKQALRLGIVKTREEFESLTIAQKTLAQRLRTDGDPSVR